MLRFLVYLVLFYILSLVVTSVLRSFSAWKTRAGQPPLPPDDAETAKPHVEYRNISDAKFQDLPQPKTKAHQSDNNS